MRRAHPGSNMITKESMFAPLLQADPSFQSKWDEFCIEWQDEPEPLLYLAIADFVRHLTASLAAGATEHFDDVFEVVERWIVEGDEYVHTAAVVGFLEDLQNTNLHSATEPDDFKPWLRPESLRFWKKVEAFWAEGKIIMDD
jgi:hypothetical protein